MKAPLEGIRVADFSHVMAGPYATHLLRLMGAEVIKVEAPERGDAMRYYGADRRYDGMAPAFIAANAGKKSMVLDLKDEADLQTARELVSRCDVLVENFRPGVMARLGLGPEEARGLNPRLVYCSVSGYGQSGPRRDWPAIDNIVQATSGMMSLGGEPGGPPMRVGFPVVDTLTGQTAALAILAALFRRERTGAGEYLDVAMFDASVAFMASAMVPYLVTGRNPERTGNTGFSGQPTAGMFVARDGKHISLGVVQQHQFALLARVMGHEEWLTDPRFTTPDLRRANTPAMQALLNAEFARRDAAHWEAMLSAAGLPCGMVRDVGDALQLPGLEDRQLCHSMEIPGLPERTQVGVVGPGFLAAGTDAQSLPPPPRLGEHTAELRAWLAQPER